MTQTTRWFALPRFGDVPPEPQLTRAVAEAAEQAGLVADEPVAGWVSSRHSHDGKEWPCREQTNGARPVWLWGARARD